MSAFGLNLSLDGALGLSDFPGRPVEGQPAFDVALGTVSSDPGETLGEVVHEGTTVLRIFRAGSVYGVETTAHGRFEIAPQERRITCAPSADGWQPILPAQVLPLAATLSGLEVLHASSVVLDGEAVALTGPSGVGKTSIAARLVAGGALSLADDVTAVRLDAADIVTAYPAGNVLHLAPHESAAVTDAEGPLRDDGRRRELAHAVVAPAATAPAPLGALCLLTRGSGATSIERVVPAAGEVLGATFMPSIRSPARLRASFEIVHRLVTNVPVYRVHSASSTTAAQTVALIRDALGV